MNTGLLGGTFNPVHIAHLSIAEEARSACRLDTILFIPAADPPHKSLADSVPFSQRCDMVKLALTGNPEFCISLIEGERPGKSYSIDTIRTLHDSFPEDKLFFIIGGDSFLEIGLWHHYADIFRECNIVVVNRPACLITANPLDSLPVAIRGEFRYSAASQCLEHVSGSQVFFVPGAALDISSTQIRTLLQEGKSVAGMLHPDVEQYIHEKGIYAAKKRTSN